MRKLFLFLLCITYTSLSAQYVQTVAGVLEVPGFNDGTALSARFFNPHGIALDGAGNAYIADRYNHTIRKLSADGQVTTLAGQAGESGDVDAVGNQARFNEPWALCVTSDGIVYVADTKNNKIRRIDQQGLVTSIAGSGNFGTTDGYGRAATFGNPTGIERDGNGNLYVADHLTHIIRKITPNGLVTTIAGTPYIPGDVDGTGRAAQFWRPYGLTLDNLGNILVADEWNHKIRRVSPQGKVETVAGTGQLGLRDGTVAEATFNYPWDMTVDKAGNIYVADGYNYVIRKIDTNGQVTSFAGKAQTSGGVDGEGSAASFSGATSIAYYPEEETFFVADAYNHLIRKITLFPEKLSLLWLEGGSLICPGESIHVRASQEGFDRYIFYVDGLPVQESAQLSLELNDLSVGKHSLLLEGVRAGSEPELSNTLEVEVVSPPTPTITTVGESPIFSSDSLVLVANGIGRVRWSTSDTTVTITVKQSGDYWVELTNSAGCVGRSESVGVEVIPEPQTPLVEVIGNQVLCPGETSMLRSSITEDIQWMKNGWLLDGATEPELEVQEAGSYQVQAWHAESGQNIASEAIEIRGTPPMDISIEANPRQLSSGEQTQFRTTGAQLESWYWDFGDPVSGDANFDFTPSPRHTYEQAGWFDVQLVATDVNGCQDTLFMENFIEVRAPATDSGQEPAEPQTPTEPQTPVDPPTGDLFIPSAFTPNNDGKNDIFYVRGAINGPFELYIFDQWGNKIHTSLDQSTGWNGKVEGQDVQNGTYVYLLKAGEQTLSGHITVLR